MDEASILIRRASAKRSFTRTHNILSRQINDKCDIEIIEQRFSELKLAWNKVETEYDNYADVTFKGEEEDDDTKKWLEEIDNLFYEAGQHKVSYIKSSRKELEPNVGDTLKLDITNVYKVRGLDEINLSGEIKILYELISSSKPSDYHKALVSTAYNDVKQQYARCKDVQAKLIDLLDTETDESEMKWAKHIQSIYVDVNRNIMTYYDKIQETEEKWVKKTTGLKLEPMRMPQFSGEITDYLRLSKTGYTCNEYQRFCNICFDVMLR